MKDNRKFLTTVSITVIITAVLTFMATTQFYGVKDIPKLRATMNILNKYFYKEPDTSAIDEAAAKAAAEALADPYTQYMTADEWESFKQQLEEKYCGIGVTVTKENIDDYLLIVSSFNNSPAKAVGLDTGDKITKVEGVTTSGLTVDEVVAKIKGAEGTKVKISVLKSGYETEQDYELERKNIEIETVYSELMDNRFGYLQLSSFNENCSVKFAEHMTKLIADGASSLIIDLRGNGGGLTNEAESIANTLLPKGSVIYSTKDRSGKTEVIKTTKEGNTEIPVVILVDGNSASASELLSASIKENGRGVLVGTQTFGKALVQTMFNFYDNSALKVTIQQYFTPNGNDINLNGIEPDHIVELKTAADEQLDFAKTILSQQ